MPLQSPGFRTIKHFPYFFNPIMNLLYKIAASAGNPSLAHGNARIWTKKLARIDKQRFNAAVPMQSVH